MKWNGHLPAGAIWMLALLLALGENTFAGDENLLVIERDQKVGDAGRFGLGDQVGHLLG